MEPKEFRMQLGRALQREYKNKKFLVHADQKTLSEKFGHTVDSHILSDDDGKALFNKISEENGIPPLTDPAGYMALDNSVNATLIEKYDTTYTNALYDIEDQIKEGTGHSVRHVLASIQSNIRKDIKEYVPEDMKYSDLRFVAVDAKLEPLLTQFVNLRLSKTLTYEYSRSYEQETKDRTRQRHHEVGMKIHDHLAGEEQQSLEL